MTHENNKNNSSELYNLALYSLAPLTYILKQGDISGSIVFKIS